MDLADFTYELPPELIARHPAVERDGSRLILVRRDGSPFTHQRFADLPDLLRSGDLLVLNDSKVIPARLFARRPSGGVAELLLLEPLEGGGWEALVRPARKLRPGMRLELAAGGGAIEILAGGGERTRHVRFHLPAPFVDKDYAGSGGGVLDYLERFGQIPLPPYILHQRKVHGESATARPEDRRRYQTVYAEPPGSVAAPTAGLHFTPRILDRLRARGIEIRHVTLHVGSGTFEPVTARRIEDHRMHYERYSISPEDAAAIEAARQDPARRIVAVGTTSLRALEACHAAHGRIVAGSARTDIFIYPGFRFGVAGALITNFHLPGSTLLMLVAAFAGRERILAAYGEAIARRYRFYSYGDAMLIE